MKPRVSPRFAARAVAALCLSAAAGASHAAGVYAPYIDMTLDPTPLIDQIGVRQGIQQFHLAFVIAGDGCTPSTQSRWSGTGRPSFCPIAAAMRCGAAPWGTMPLETHRATEVLS